MKTLLLYILCQWKLKFFSLSYWRLLVLMWSKFEKSCLYTEFLDSPHIAIGWRLSLSTVHPAVCVVR